MNILFTTSSYPTSWLIRKITKEDCSHVALYFPDNQEVLHCNFLGVRLESFESFIVHNKILHAVQLAEQKSAQELYEKYKYVKYDLGALLYLGMRFMFRGLPKVNLWQSTGMFLCTELVTDIIAGEADSLITPHLLSIKLTTK